MNKLLSSVLLLAVFLPLFLLLFSCDKNEDIDDEFPHVEGTTRGVYKVEVSMSGEVALLKPSIIFHGRYYWVGQHPEKRLFDGEGKDVGTIEAFQDFPYKGFEEMYTKPIIRQTTRKAYGLGVSVQFTNADVVLQNPAPTVTITYKGYLNGKLIKTDTQIASFNTTKTGGFSHSAFWVGTDSSGLPASVFNESLF